MEQIISIPSIIIICYMLIELLKAVFKNEVFKKFLPIISCLLGIALGITAFYTYPTIIPADNVFTAILIGGASGLSATGTNQIIKQMKEKLATLKENCNSIDKNNLN